VLHSQLADSCAGKVQLASVATLPLDVADLKLPTGVTSWEDATPEQVNNSPIAVDIKAGLATALNVNAADITIKSIAATTGRRRRLQDGIAVDYVVALPVADVAAAKTASATAAPAVTVSAAASASDTELAEVTGTVTALKSYAWVETEPTCPTDCGQDATTPATTFACEEDGTAADDALCVVPLGTKPTGTVSCAATRSCGTLCVANEKVVAHFCEACEAGKTNAAGDGTAGADTTCDTTTDTDTDTVPDLNAAGQRAQQSAAPTVVPAIGLVTGMLAALQLWV